MSGSSSIFDSMYSSYRTSAPSTAYQRSYVDYDTLSSGYSSSGSRIGSGNSGGGGGYSSISTARGRTNRFTDSDYRSAYSSSNSRSGTASSSSSSRYYGNTPSYMDDVTSRFSGISTHSAGYSYRPRHLNLSDMAGVSAIDLGGDNSSSSARNHSTSYRNSVLIDTAPAYDRYGKQMSNYDKWKQARGEGSGGGGYDILSPRSETSGYSGISASSNSGYNDTNANIGGGGSSSSSYSMTIKENGFEPEVRKSRFSSRFMRNNKSSNNNNSSTEDETDELRIVSKPISPLKDDDFAPFSAGGRFNNSSGNLGGVSKRSASVMPSTRFSSSSSSSSSSSFFPSGVREKLSRYNVRDVKGDGGCYYRCLSLYFSGAETNYMTYRREVMAYIRQHLDNYSTMIRSEIGIGSSTNDYFSRKTRADRQDWAETTEIIATCVVYNINVHVLALVPGKRIWEWLHFDPSIGTGKPSTATEDIYLYNQGSVHFQLCTPK